MNDNNMNNNNMNNNMYVNNSNNKNTNNKNNNISKIHQSTLSARWILRVRAISMMDCCCWQVRAHTSPFTWHP